MAAQLREFTLWLTALTGFLFAIVKTLQGLLGYVGVHRRGEVATFESVLSAQDKLLVDCRKTCDELLRQSREREKDYQSSLAAKDFELKQERHGHNQTREQMYRQLAEAHSRIFECEGILRRHGWHDAREHPREGPWHPPSDKKEA